MLIKSSLQFRKWVCIYNTTFLTTHHKRSSKNHLLQHTGGYTLINWNEPSEGVYCAYKPYSQSHKSDATSLTDYSPDAHRVQQAVKRK